jgi:hypothetical protein
LNWYFAYNLFRLVAIVQGIAKRVIDGNASHRHAATMAARVRPLAAQAWACAVRAGADVQGGADVKVGSRVRAIPE